MITPAEYVLQLKTQLSLSPTSVSLNARGGGGDTGQSGIEGEEPTVGVAGAVCAS